MGFRDFGFGGLGLGFRDRGLGFGFKVVWGVQGFSGLRV